MKRKFILIGLLSVAIFAASFFIFSEDELPATENVDVAKNEIVVYVSGQVKNPAVITIEDNGNLRLVDAVNSAGGMTELADTEIVNLAEPLTDGQHIHIPTKEIFLRPTQEVSAAVDSGDKVNINTADAERLATLKGIGPALAQRIIEYREQNGAFKSIDEIKNVRGIGDKKFDAFKDKITT